MFCFRTVLVNIMHLRHIHVLCGTFLVSQTVKHLPTMRETQDQSLDWEDLLEKAMAIHSSTLAWKTPWMEESGRLRSMWSQSDMTEWPLSFMLYVGFPDGSDCKETACNASDLGSIPRWGRSPGEADIYPLQYSCLDNFMDRGTLWATVHGVTKSQIWLSN